MSESIPIRQIGDSRRDFFRFAAFFAAGIAGQRLLADTAIDVRPIGILLGTTYTTGTNRDGAAGHLPAGRGKMDYAHFMRLLIAYKNKGPILLHGLTEQQVPECLAFIREKRDYALHSA